MKTLRQIERQTRDILTAGGFSNELSYNDVKKVVLSLKPDYRVARLFVEKYSPSRSFQGFDNLRKILN